MDPTANAGSGQGHQSRSSSSIPPALNSISQTVRKTIVTITEPLSPSDSEFDRGASSDTPGFKGKLRHWNTLTPIKGSDHVPSTEPADQAAASEPRTLMTLPDELQILVLSFLDFPDIERLRHASKYWHRFATPRLVRSIFGPDAFRTMLLQHCRVCLAHCPAAAARTGTTPLDAGFPLSSRCLPCAVQSRDGTVRIGRKVRLGDASDYWACRWCGWPITDEPSTSHVQFHRGCYEKYALVLLAFFLLGLVQFVIGVVAAALVWRYFAHDQMVVASTAVGFVLTWGCVVLITFRGNRVRTYHWALFIELAIVGLWIPSMYKIGFGLATSHLEMSLSAATALAAFVGLNMLFRVLNILGNGVLLMEYDRTRHYVPRIPIWRRFMNPILTALVFWTYPQHTERKTGPEWA